METPKEADGDVMSAKLNIRLKKSSKNRKQTSKHLENKEDAKF